MIKNNTTTLTFQLFSFIFSVFGILSVVFKDGVFEAHQFMYYTIFKQCANFFYVFLLIYQNLKERKIKKECNIVKSSFLFICVIDILVTMIVYWLILRPNSINSDPTYKTMTFSNLSTHLITPLLALINFIVFDVVKNIKYKDIYCSTIFPLSYFAVVTIFGFCGFVFPDTGKRFPYFFTDYDKYGLKVLLYVFAITLFFIILSHIFYYFIKTMYKNLYMSNELKKVVELTF